GTPRETGVDGMECPRDGCESDVVDIDRLREFLEDSDWLRSLDATQRHALRGLRVWVLDELDRPPPGTVGSRKQVIRWCEDAGRTYSPGSKQVGITDWGAA
ncbi:MAG: hypothetical protein ABEH77_10925, partial [Halobacteriaceae archaeon]